MNPRRLAPRVHGGPAGHRQGVRRANEAERLAIRRRKSWDLYRQGKTMMEIGKANGTSNKTAWQDVTGYMEMLKAGQLSEEQRRLQHLDTMAYVRAPHISNRRSAASARIVHESLAQEARLLGLNKTPTDGMFTAQEVLGMLRQLQQGLMEAIADKAVLLAVREVFLRVGGRMGAGTVDIPAVPALPEASGE